MKNSVSYKPEIDGLRALAVLSVIIFHMDASWLPGGFVGVDIFFVISGFLITRIIVTDLANQQFSFANFYARRIKRILPAFYVVLLVTIVVGYVLMQPNDIKYLNRATQQGVFFLINHFFANNSGYFDPDATEMPLLHTWSLAVEEQFYFLWPLLLFFFVKNNKIKIILVSLIICLASFLTAQFFLTGNKSVSFAYFSLITRGGELLVGAILALFFCNEKKQNRFSSYSQMFTLAGIFLIIYSLFSLNEQSSFPGINALFPCVGAALVLYGVHHEQHFLSRLLSTAGIVYLGKMSYSLYLWHWPILAYFRYCYGSYGLPLSWIGVAGALTLILSYLSVNYIENTTRRLNISFRKSFLLFYIIPTILILGLLSVPAHYFDLNRNQQQSILAKGNREINKNNTSAKDKIPAKGNTQAKNNTPMKDKPHTKGNNNAQAKNTPTKGSTKCIEKLTTSCIHGDLKAPQNKVLLIGDSHANHLKHFVETLGKKYAWNAHLFSTAGCSPVFDHDYKRFKTASKIETCKKLTGYFVKNHDNYETIILASRWDIHVMGEHGVTYLKNLDKTLSTLTNKGKRVYVISQVPLLSNDPKRANKLIKLGLPAKVEFNQRSSQANAKVKAVVDAHKNVEWVDLTPLFSNFTGGIRYNNQLVYMDNNHLTGHGSQTLARLVQTDKRWMELADEPTK